MKCATYAQKLRYYKNKRIKEIKYVYNKGCE